MLHARYPWIVTYMNKYIFNDDNFQQNLFYNMGPSDSPKEKLYGVDVQLLKMKYCEKCMS